MSEINMHYVHDLEWKNAKLQSTIASQAEEIDELKKQHNADELYKDAIATSNNKRGETIASQAETIRLLKEDGERLADMDGYCCKEHEMYVCEMSYQDIHDPDCPIATHNALMEQLKKVGE